MTDQAFPQSLHKFAHFEDAVKRLGPSLPYTVNGRVLNLPGHKAIKHSAIAYASILPLPTCVLFPAAPLPLCMEAEHEDMAEVASQSLQPLQVGSGTGRAPV